MDGWTGGQAAAFTQSIASFMVIESIDRFIIASMTHFLRWTHAAISAGVSWRARIELLIREYFFRIFNGRAYCFTCSFFQKDMLRKRATY